MKQQSHITYLRMDLQSALLVKQAVSCWNIAIDTFRKVAVYLDKAKMKNRHYLKRYLSYSLETLRSLSCCHLKCKNLFYRAWSKHCHRNNKTMAAIHCHVKVISLKHQSLWRQFLGYKLLVERSMQ